MVHGFRSSFSVFSSILLTLAGVLAASRCEKPPATPTPGPPTITCPADITITGVTGPMRNVVYAAPTVGAGAPPLLTSCTPASETVFPIGATTVTCTVTDAQQRQASCSFVVSLESLVLNVRKIVAFGDSVTAGEDGRRLQIRSSFVDPLHSYPALLEARLSADFPNQSIPVINEGRGGEFAADGVRRLRDEVLPRHQPDVLLLLEGYNDLLNKGLAAVNDVVAALRQDIRTARAGGVAQVFVSTLTPSRPATGPFNRAIDPRAIQETNAKLIEMAAAEGAFLVRTYDAFAGREQELVEQDGLHLTVLGNEVLAGAFYDAIRQAHASTFSRLW